MDILSVTGLNKKMGKKQILTDITFNIKEGEILGLVGPNGAGKSTLIKCILGLYKLNSGEVKINGFDRVKEFEESLSSVGAIIENPEVYGYLTAYENMMLYKRMYENVTKEEVEELLKLVKLDGRKKSPVKTFSLGMKQRLGIAISLLSKPKLLILDEPTNGLDPLGIKELRELIKKLVKETNMSVLISSHILSEIELICDRIAIIDNGKIIEFKTKEDKKEELVKVLYKTNNTSLLVQELINMNANYEQNENGIIINTKYENLPNLNKYFINKNISINEIIVLKSTLEDEFVKITSGTKGQIR